MNVAPIKNSGLKSVQNLYAKNKHNTLKKTISPNKGMQDGYYGTPRGGCASAFIGMAIGAAASVLIVTAGIIGTALATLGGAFAGAIVGKIVGVQLDTQNNKKEG